MHTRIAAALAALITATAAHAGPHEHGVARLAVAIEGGTLSVALDGALDGFLGFERAPRTDAERQAATALLARLRDGASLFKPDAAASCRAGDASVSAPVLEPGAKPRGEHAELEAQWTFACGQPQALRTLEVALFDAFRRLQRIDVQVALPKGQAKVTLKRPARTVPLQR